MDSELELERQLEAALKLELKMMAERALDYYEPYVKQMDFHALGLECDERLFMAGNQLGKTEAGAFETACHLTGEYPGWWKGVRFTRPVRCWVAGETGLATRDTIQRKLMGKPGVVAEQGHGYIPKAAIVDVSLARGVTDAYDTVQVRHKSGGISTVKFMSYEMGRGRWQGETLDFVWFDEEPPADIYSEGRTRTNAGGEGGAGGFVFVTFTPLKGRSDVVLRYLDEATPRRQTVTMTIYDVGHYSEERKKEIIAAYPAHERDARARGVPVLGSGRIFAVVEENIVVDPFEIPPYWVMIAGIDFGIEHPTACSWLAWDREADVMYVIGEYRQKDTNIPTNAVAIKTHGCGYGNVPVSWPHDAGKRDGPNLETLKTQYKNAGLRMTPEQAKNPDGSNSVEAGVADILLRMQTGKWKVFSNMVMWLEEFRFYHRKDGKIVPEKDDLLSASRYAMMGASRFAKPVKECYTGFKRKGQKQRFARGSGYLKRS